MRRRGWGWGGVSGSWHLCWGRGLVTEGIYGEEAGQRRYEDMCISMYRAVPCSCGGICGEEAGI